MKKFMVSITVVKNGGRKEIFIEAKNKSEAKSKAFATGCWSVKGIMVIK